MKFKKHLKELIISAVIGNRKICIIQICMILKDNK